VLRVKEGISADFNPWSWAVGLSLVCFAPLLLISFGYDFLTQVIPMTAESVSGLSRGELAEAGHAAMRGSYTHTMLEWSAMCAAVFCCILAFVQFRLTSEASLPIIGVALICAGAMDGFHTFAANRLITSVAENKDLIPFTWAICRLFHSLILLVGIGIALGASRSSQGSQSGSIGFIAAVSALFMVVAYGVISYCANSAVLPQTMYPDAAEMVRGVLAEHGTEVVIAHNGQAGLDVLDDFNPDVIVLDLMMPVVDGFEFLQRLRGDLNREDLPVVVLSAKSLSRSESESLAGHQASVLTKESGGSEQLLDAVLGRVLASRRTLVDESDA
jgi:CheY-like chemotaxis protein